MKRLIAAAAGLAVVVSIAVTSIGGAQAPGERTFTLVEKPISSKFIDNPPHLKHQRPSPGDFFVFSSGLYDGSGARVGTVLGHCTISAPASLPGECEGVAKLKDGQLTFGTATTNSRTTVIAITGGTGAYEGARGTVTSVNRTGADNSPSDDTVHILG